MLTLITFSSEMNNPCCYFLYVSADSFYGLIRLYKMKEKKKRSSLSFFFVLFRKYMGFLFYEDMFTHNVIFPSMNAQDCTHI